MSHAPRRRLASSSAWILAAIALGATPSVAQSVALGDPADNPGPVRVVADSKHDLSPPLREMPMIPPYGVRALESEAMHPFPLGNENTPDAALQTSLPELGQPAIPGTLVQFEGVAAAQSSCGCTPPDTNGEIGPRHFVQMVNSALAVYSRSGSLLWGPAAINSIWAGFGGACQNENAGDPVVVYDQMADRWVISQFTDTGSPFFECIAVSQTADPTGAWYRYAFQTSTTKFNDYPKLGVWTDGYYMTANLFILPSTWAGTGVYAFDRAKMLAGLPATMQLFELPPADWGGMLPSDLDGFGLPPAGAPNVMVEVLDGSWDPGNWPNDELHFHQFHVDWTTPANTTFNQTPIQVPVATFDGLLCNFGACVPQSGTATKLDTLSDRLMYRLAYRNFGTHEALVLNHTVDAGTNQAAIRWYEIRDPRGNPPTIFQQSTFAPTTLQRWMGSIAMDSVGNAALGYNGSSSAQSPDIRYTGRAATDPLNQMTLGEMVMIASSASQTSASRWGDYSDLTVDPLDDCTFWLTTEYAVGSAFSWHTRIGAFRLDQCPTLFRDNFEIGTTNFWTSTTTP
ncbi:MAG: hypothetical protein H6511_01120 [Holophagales bacterium]|nr:hypothetical protein [Holophagales bacterium]